MSSGEKPMNNTIVGPVDKIELDNRLSLRYYYRVADNLLQEANIHRQMKHNVDLYTTLLKLASLLAETIPIHRDYTSSNQAEKSYYRKKLLLALEEMEFLKPQVQWRVNVIRNGLVQGQEISRPDRPNPVQVSTLHLEIPLENNWHISRPCTPPTASSSTTTQYHNSNPTPSAPPVESLVTNDSQNRPHSINSTLVDATSSMVGNLSVESVEETGNKVASSSSSCVICLDAPVEGACVPCGHMVGCMSCLNEIKSKSMSCPVCRAKVVLVLRLYAV